MRVRTTPRRAPGPTVGPPPRHGLLARAGRQAVLATAAAQLVAAAASGPGVGQPGGGTTPDLLVTPASWTFAVWGLVIAGALAYGVYQLRSQRGDLPALQAVAWPLVGAQAASVAWLVLDATAPSWTTVVAIVAMLALLAVAYGRALRWRRQVPVLGRLLLLGVLGVWTGWSAALLPVNAACALLDLGLPASGAAAVAWQAVVLAAVAGVGVGVVVLWRARPASVAAVVWALAGVAAGAAGRGAPLLAGLAAAATLALAVWATWWRWQDLRQRAEAALGLVSRSGPTVSGQVVGGQVVDPEAREAGRRPLGR